MSDSGRDADMRYAQGAISREEWLRLQGSPRSGGPLPAIRSVGPRTTRRNAVVLSAVVVVLLVAFASWAFLGQNFARGLNPTYSSPRQLSAADLADLEGSATTGLAFAGNDSLWFSEGTVTMVVYASPAAHDLTFVVRGLVNPTIHMASGSRISLTVVNMDPDEYHNWALTARGPPYTSMPMMASGMMMAMMMLGPMNNDGMWSQQVAFTPVVGLYWYLCTIGNHAAQGMYGSLVVR